MHIPNHADPLDSGVFDHTVVHEMRDSLGDATLSMLMECLARDLAKAKGDLHEGQMRDDLNALKLVAHSLKGLAGQYGAWHLAQEASNLGDLCARNDHLGLGSKVRLVESLCQQAITDSVRYRH